MTALPTRKLQLAPVVFVLAQARFPAHLKMSTRVPEIQDLLRQQGFTRYAEEQMQQVIFGPEIKTETGTRWVFANRNRKEAVVLAANFVVFETSQYEVFTTLVERFGGVLNIIKEHVGLEFVEQLGLRYVDLIRQGGGMEIRDILQEPLRGLTNDDLGTTSLQCQFVIQGKTPYGDLHIRSFEGRGNDFMPPDLASTHLEYCVELPQDEAFRVLDFDHIARGEIDFDTKNILDKLRALHESTSKAFHAAVTPAAMEYWRTGKQQ